MKQAGIDVFHGGGAGAGWLLIRAKNERFSWLKRIFIILIRASIERQIPVIRATLVSAPPPLASASKSVYGCFFYACRLQTIQQSTNRVVPPDTCMICGADKNTPYTYTYTYIYIYI